MKFTNERNYLLLLILVDTGLRISEIMNLKQYHIEESQIKVENGKGKKDRVVHCYLTVLLRDIDKYVDFSFIYLLVEEKYDQSNGRPSLDPVMLIKLPLIQYLYGIKSMRQRIKEVEVNMAYR